MARGRALWERRTGRTGDRRPFQKATAIFFHNNAGSLPAGTTLFRVKLRSSSSKNGRWPSVGRRTLSGSKVIDFDEPSTVLQPS
jgi:hypothetical protein